jgi:hypothetical protein
MNSQQLDELYFAWLYRQVADSETTDPMLTYWNLLRILFRKEFVWVISNDDNRAEDGKELRREFIAEERLEPEADPLWIEYGCSVLELMVGLARRLAFVADGEAHYWFWKMMENLGIPRYGDDRKRLPEKKIQEALDRVIFRTYEPNGTGGFFPLERTHRDQRTVELWYQLAAYVVEQSE